MQQSSATQSLHLSFWGLRKIVACSHSSSQCLLVSTVFGTVSSLHPTSFFLIFILVYIYVARLLAGYHENTGLGTHKTLEDTFVLLYFRIK